MSQFDTATSVEGKDFIAISKYSKTKLGKQLMPGYPVEFTTVFGKVGNVLAAKQYLTKVGYPTHLRSKKKLTSTEIESVTVLPTTTPTNYKAILIYLICERLQNSDLVKEIASLNRGIKVTPLMLRETNRLGVKVKIVNESTNSDIKEYCSALKDCINLIHSGKFDADGIARLIKRSKVKKNSNLFENCAINIQEIA